MKKLRNIAINGLIWAIILTGIGLLLYPTLSSGRNRQKQLSRIEEYDTAVQELENSDSEQYFAAAQTYNAELAKHSTSFSESETDPRYDSLLNVDDSGIMGYITIPSINVKLPVYHSTRAEVLDIGAGHLYGSSLPVGGAGTHAVISAHTGLPSARLFTDVEKMQVGDTFSLSVLDRELTYEVESIYVIEPSETSYLSIIPEGDYVTLMTCTPYGINSHRLLLRSKRVEQPEEKNIRIYADAVKVDPMITYTIITLPLLVILLLIWILTGRRAENVGNRKNIDRKDE